MNGQLMLRQWLAARTHFPRHRARVCRFVNSAGFHLKMCLIKMNDREPERDQNQGAQMPRDLFTI